MLKFKKKEVILRLDCCKCASETLLGAIGDWFFEKKIGASKIAQKVAQKVAQL